MFCPQVECAFIPSADAHATFHCTIKEIVPNFCGVYSLAALSVLIKGPFMTMVTMIVVSG